MLNNDQPKQNQVIPIDIENSKLESSKKWYKLTKVKALMLMMILNVTFFLVELIIGNLTNSNTLVADSFHMLSDLISFIIALISIKISEKTSSSKNTFGWARAEILGSLINAVFLLALCFSIIVEAISRFFEPRDLKNIDLILIVGTVGLLINLLGLVIFGFLGSGHLHKHSEHKLKQHKSRNMNIRGVFLHVLSDALGSIAIIISTLMIKYIPYGDKSNINWKIFIDPVLSILLAIFIIMSTLPLLRESSLILMQTVPKDIDLEDLKEKLISINGVLELHHLHVWTLSSDCNIASLHLKILDLNSNNIFNSVKNLMHKNNIHSTTVQIEHDSIENSNDKCIQLDCKQHQCCRLRTQNNPTK